MNWKPKHLYNYRYPIRVTYTSYVDLFMRSVTHTLLHAAPTMQTLYGECNAPFLFDFQFYIKHQSHLYRPVHRVRPVSPVHMVLIRFVRFSSGSHGYHSVHTDHLI